MGSNYIISSSLKVNRERKLPDEYCICSPNFDELMKNIYVTIKSIESFFRPSKKISFFSDVKNRKKLFEKYEKIYSNGATYSQNREEIHHLGVLSTCEKLIFKFENDKKIKKMSVDIEPQIRSDIKVFPSPDIIVKEKVKLKNRIFWDHKYSLEVKNSPKKVHRQLNTSFNLGCIWGAGIGIINKYPEKWTISIDDIFLNINRIYFNKKYFLKKESLTDGLNEMITLKKKNAIPYIAKSKLEKFIEEKFSI